MGVTAMVGNLWPDAEFKIGCLNSKASITAEDEVVVLASPDPQGFGDCQRIVDQLPDDCTVIMFNPRLARSAVTAGLV